MSDTEIQQTKKRSDEKSEHCHHMGRFLITEREPWHYSYQIDVEAGTCAGKVLPGVPERGVRVLCTKCGEERYHYRDDPALSPQLKQALVLLEAERDRLWNQGNTQQQEKEREAHEEEADCS